jgi:PrcB C-terminal
MCDAAAALQSPPAPSRSQRNNISCGALAPEDEEVGDYYTYQPGELKMRVAFSTISKGEYSGVRTVRNVVVANPEDWEHLWREHTSDVSTPEPVPRVNFDAEFVVAVFSGEKPTSGYGVKIKRMKTLPAALGRSPVLVVEFTEQEAGDLEMDVIGSPHHIVKVRSWLGNFDEVVFVAR